MEAKTEHASDNEGEEIKIQPQRTYKFMFRERQSYFLPSTVVANHLYEASKYDIFTTMLNELFAVLCSENVARICSHSLQSMLNIIESCERVHNISPVIEYELTSRFVKIELKDGIRELYFRVKIYHYDTDGEKFEGDTINPGDHLVVFDYRLIPVHNPRQFYRADYTDILGIVDNELIQHGHNVMRHTANFLLNRVIFRAIKDCELQGVKFGPIHVEINPYNVTIKVWNLVSCVISKSAFV